MTVVQAPRANEDRADGYVTEIGYTYDYYPELNPLHMRLAMLHAGFAVPKVETACELGCGQGVSLAIHAAASPVRWFGMDVNREHVSFARSLADAAHTDVGLFDASFAEFGARTDLPDFDFVALHGVWSWVSDRNRHELVRFLRQKLKPGGVLYVSYNTLPGLASVVPLRDLLVEHANSPELTGLPLEERIERSLAAVERLIETRPASFGDHPEVIDRLRKLAGQDRRYLAHEYFNRDWEPMHFADMARWLEGAGLSFACAARPIDSIDALSLDRTQHAVIAEITDRGLRETTRDRMLDRTFRLDYWAKQPARLSPQQRRDALRRERVVPIAHRPALPLPIRGALTLNGAASLVATAAAVLQALGDQRPRTFEQIEAALSPRQSPEEIADAAILLASQGCLASAQDDSATSLVRSRTEALNKRLLDERPRGGSIRHLASPLTGGGIEVPRLQRAFLRALGEGLGEPAQWADAAWRSEPRLKTQPGLADMEGFRRHAAAFAEDRLAVLRALQVA